MREFDFEAAKQYFEETAERSENQRMIAESYYALSGIALYDESDFE